MQTRLQEIIFECILTAFNGSNYDNYLICNALIIIQTKLNQKIKIFKKGASISTIHLSIKSNLNKLSKITTNQINKKSKKQKKVNNKWTLNLYIKDIRNLVAANVSLDKLGQLFNLNVQKLCFPYEKAVTIYALKHMSSLKPYDEEFWRDNFSNKIVPLENRLQAQQILKENNFENLYEFGVYYLMQDCLLLHSIVITLFESYLKENINLFTRRNFSQSSLAYQQFFIIEPSKQIVFNNAPKKINNAFFNYFIKQGVTGGLCTSFVHGEINKNTIINEHFNYLDYPNLDPKIWQNFYNCKSWNKCFNENPTTISTIDIRSLYPSAAIKKMPLNSPLFFSRFIPKDFQQINKTQLISYNLQSFCKNSQELGDHNQDYFKLLNNPPIHYNEYYALENYLQKLPKNIKVIRFQSDFTALGQLYFSEFPIDGFLSFYCPQSNTSHIKLIQYNSVYYHGHNENCDFVNTDAEKEKKEQTSKTRSKILELTEHFKNHFENKNLVIEYVEICDCDFFLHKIPISSNNFLSYKKQYKYKNFLENILNKNLTGFLVVKNLEIQKNNQNPIIGFIIQKVEYDYSHLSPYTQEKLNDLISSKRVVAINKSKGFMVISTEYFTWLYKTFGFEKTPDIYHALLFQTDYYLKPYIENKLQQRKDLKEMIKNETNIQNKQSYEIKAELIKLMLNSCYGFTLCNTNSSKFKLFENRKQNPKSKQARKNINSSTQITTNVYLVEKKKKIMQPFQTLLGHVGCYILFHSKIILLKRLLFLLNHLNPTKAQLLYMDTDSAHFLMKHKNFVDNVDDNLKISFMNLFCKHFETGNKLSGIWVQEGYFDNGNYIGEKCYKLYNTNDNYFLTHMKGLNNYFQNSYATNNIDLEKYSVIKYNIFYKSPDFTLFKSYMSKNLFKNYIPIKRYFVFAKGSLPLKF